MTNLSKKPFPRKALSKKATWMIVGAGSAMLAGALVRRGLEASWRAVTDDDPPGKPESPDTDWLEAIAWTAASAIAIGLAEFFAKRGAAEGWLHATGKRPPA